MSNEIGNPAWLRDSSPETVSSVRGLSLVDLVGETPSAGSSQPKERVSKGLHQSPESTSRLQAPTQPAGSNQQSTHSQRPYSAAYLRQQIADNTVRVVLRSKDEIHLGSGCVVQSKSGKGILTDDHVFGGTAETGSTVEIDYKGVVYEAKIIGRDHAHDLAILSLPEKLHDLKGLTMAASGRNQSGQHLTLAGFPADQLRAGKDLEREIVQGSKDPLLSEGSMTGESPASECVIADLPDDLDYQRPLEIAALLARGGESGGAIINDHDQVVGLLEAAGEETWPETDSAGKTIWKTSHQAYITPVDFAKPLLNHEQQH